MLTHTRVGHALAALAVFGLAAAPARAAQINWKNNTNGKWDAAKNWAGGKLPGQGDDAVNPFSDVLITHDMGNDTVTNFQTKGSFLLSGGALTVLQKVLLDGAVFNLNGGTLRKATITGKPGGAGGFVAIGDSGNSALDGVSLLTETRDLKGGTTTVTGGLTLKKASSSTFSLGGGSVLKFDGSQEMKNGFFLAGTAMVQLTPGTALTLRDNRFRMGEDANAFTLGNASPDAKKPTSLIFEGENSFRRSNIIGEAMLNLTIAADQIVNHGELSFPGRDITVMVTARDFTNTSSGMVSQINDLFTLTADAFTNNGTYDDIGISTYNVKKVFNNGTFTVGNLGKVTFAQVAGAPRANTNKQLTVDKGGQLSFLNGLRMTVVGNITVNGTLNIQENGVAAQGIQKAGTVGGNGTINGGWKVEKGFVKPGSSPGELTIGGDYTQEALGELDIELGGPLFDPNTGPLQYSRLAVTGAAALDGLLSVGLVDNFVPQYADVFDVLTAASGLSGSFLDAPPPSPGLPGHLDFSDGTFDVYYLGSPSGPSLVRLTHFQSNAAVPEPSPVALLALGLLPLGWMVLIARKKTSPGEDLTLVASDLPLPWQGRGRAYHAPTPEGRSEQYARPCVREAGGSTPPEVRTVSVDRPHPPRIFEDEPYACDNSPDVNIGASMASHQISREVLHPALSSPGAVPRVEHSPGERGNL